MTQLYTHKVDWYELNYTLDMLDCFCNLSKEIYSSLLTRSIEERGKKEADVEDTTGYQFFQGGATTLLARR